jgi:hypothetical protein
MQDGASFSYSPMFCANCGREIADNSVCCQYSGAVSKAVAGTGPVQQKQWHTNRNIWIVTIAIVLVIALVFVAIAASSTAVRVTGVNISEQSSSGSSQPVSQAPNNAFSVTGGSQFTWSFTLTNPSNSTMSFAHSSVTITTSGFTLISIDPSLPIYFNPGSSMIITLTIQAPNRNYEGLLGILVSFS